MGMIHFNFNLSWKIIIRGNDIVREALNRRISRHCNVIYACNSWKCNKVVHVKIREVNAIYLQRFFLIMAKADLISNLIRLILIIASELLGVMANYRIKWRCPLFFPVAISQSIKWLCILRIMSLVPLQNPSRWAMFRNNITGWFNFNVNFCFRHICFTNH